MTRRRASNRAFAPSPWWLLALAILPAIAFALHFGGRMVLGWDSLPPLRPGVDLRLDFSSWNWGRDLGQARFFGFLTEVPVDLIYLVLGKIFGIALGQQIFLTALFVLPALTMYACVRRLFPHERSLPFVAAACYTLCPLLFVRLYIPIVPVQLVYALLPLLVNVWVDAVRRGPDARRLLGLALAEMAFWPCSVNLAYWLVPQLTAPFVAFTIGWASRPPRRARAMRAFLPALLVIAAMNAFWFVPQVMFGVVEGSDYEHEAVQRAYTVGIRKDVAANSSLSYTLRMTSRAQINAGDTNGTYWTDAPAFENPLYAAIFFAWFILSGIAIALRGGDRRIVALGVLLAFALFVMKGESAPFAFLLDLAYRVPLAGTIFRDGFDKLLPMAAFAFSILLPAGCFALAARSPSRALQPRVAIGLLVAVVAIAYPFWSGQMFMARDRGPSLATIPPPDAFEIARRMDGIHSRILFLPPSDNTMLTATNWGYYGQNPFIELSGAAMISSPLSVQNRPATDEITSALYGAISSGDAAAFRLYATAANVGYVLVAHDMNYAYYGGPTPGQMDSFLGGLSATRVADIVGPYTLWRLTWVPDQTRPLERREIVGYDTSFEKAFNVAGHCGSGAFALIPLTDGSCMLRHASIDQSAWVTMTGRIASGLLTIAGSGAGATSALAKLGDGDEFAQIGDAVVGASPTAVDLLPCMPFSYAAYRTAGAARAVPLGSASPFGDALSLPLGALPAQWIAVHLVANADRSNVSAQIVDALNHQVMASTKGLAAGSNDLVFFALPGRAYALSVQGQVAFGRARDDVASVAVMPVVRDRLGSLVTPAVAGASCAPQAFNGAFASRDRPLDVALAVDGGNVLVRTYGIEPPYDVLRVSLPPHTTMVRSGGDLIENTAVDESFSPGFTVPLQGYRTVGAPQTIAIADLQNSGPVLVSDVDVARGRMTLQTNKGDQWVHVDVPTLAPGAYSITMNSSGVIGSYGAAVVDAVTSAVVASRRNVSGPRLSLAFYARPKQSLFLFVYPTLGAGQSSAALRISSMTITSIAPTGTSSFSLPRVVPTVASNPDAVMIGGSIDRGVIPMPGGRLDALPVPTAIVVDTQFDPFWSTIVWTDVAPFVKFLPHVVADGYKNAWLVPAQLAGRVTSFFLLDEIGYAGFALAALVLAILALRARRNTA